MIPPNILNLPSYRATALEEDKYHVQVQTVERPTACVPGRPNPTTPWIAMADTVPTILHRITLYYTYFGKDETKS